MKAAKEFLLKQPQQKVRGWDTLNPIIIILCTEFYHLGEGAHFASFYMSHSIIAPILEIIFLHL